MPNNKRRKGRESNKKKKKGHARRTKPGPQCTSNSATAPTTMVVGVGESNEMPSSSSLLQGRKPNFEKFELREALQENYPTLYARYKAATKRFFEYMVDNTPESVRGMTKSVNSLIVAAAWMEEQEFTIDRSILKDLQLAIRTRARVAKSIFGGGDAGHKHILSVLTYCWTILVVLPRTGQPKRVQENVEEEKENRFAALEDYDEDVDEVDEEDKEIFPSTPVPRPEPEPEPMTLDDLMTSDDRNDVIMFLLTLDELMEFVVDQYRVITKNWDYYAKIGAPKSAIIDDFLEAAVSTNMAIQRVRQLEMDLQTQHPHLTTPYRLLSTLVLPEITENMTRILRAHAASKRCTERDIISFLGDCMECNFRAPSDALNKKEFVVQDFCTNFEVDSEGSNEIMRIFEGLHKIFVLEVPIGPEKADSNSLRGIVQTCLPSHPQSHSWIRNMPNIGEDRAIHHTIRLIQGFGPVIKSTPDNKMIGPKRGFFGHTPWRPGRSKKTRDLDELLMADILPQWVLMCRKGILSMKLPREAELCPLFELIRDYVKNPDRAVSWSLSFAIHAMLTAILETDRITDDLADLSKVTFDNFFRQLDWAMEISRKEDDYLKNRVFMQNMVIVMFLKNLGLHVFGKRAIWNPLFGGTIFSFLTFFGNLEAGCALIDCNAQLRIVLHLYHALLLNGILHRGQLPMLDILFDCFKKSRGVWEGPPPQKGAFVQRFWTCFGMDRAEAKRMAEEARQIAQKKNRFAPHNGSSWKRRKMNPIEPAEIATCFRRVVDRDFHDVEDKYHTPEQRRKSKDTEQYQFAVCTNDTLDAIDNEQKLLAFNLPSTGAILEQFVCSLIRIMQWEPLLRKTRMGNVTLGNDKRQGFVVLFAQYLLGALDFAQDPLDYEFLNVPVGRASAQFMRVFFDSLDTGNTHWFQAIEVEDQRIL